MSTKIIFDSEGDVCLQLQSYTKAPTVAWEIPREPEYTSQDPPQSNNDIWTDVDATSTATDNPVLHLIVSSKVLSIASPIFKRMFNGGFREANDLAACQAAGRVYTLDLPKDDPLATLILCSVLHPGPSTEHVPDLPDAATLEQLGILVDKYQCPRVLSIVGRLWLSCDFDDGVMKNISQLPFSWEPGLYSRLHLRRIGPGARDQVKGLVQCLFFAYIVDLPFEYATIASTIVRHSNEAWLENAFQSPLSDHLKHPVLETLRRNREHCCLRLYKAMREPRSWLAEVQTLSVATELAAKILAFEEILVAKSLWFSLDEMSTVHVKQVAVLIRQIWQIERKLQTAIDPESLSRRCLPPLARNLWEALSDAARQVTSRSPRQMTWSVRNLLRRDETMTCCLVCLKTGDVSHSQGACRVPHHRHVLETIENSETAFDKFANRVSANIQEGFRKEDDDGVETDDGVNGDQNTIIDGMEDGEMTWSQLPNVGDSDYQDIVDEEE